MGQRDVWFLEPNPLNAVNRYGQSVVFDDNDAYEIPSHPEWLLDPYDPRWIKQFRESIISMDRCYWDGCDEFLWDRTIPLCRHHAVKVWAYVDHREAKGVHMIARQEQLEETKRHEEAVAAVHTTPGWVYYLRVGELIKIGFTLDIDRRLAEYPPNVELLAVHAGTWELEQSIHKRFDLDRVHGREWYQESEAMRAHLQRAKELTPKSRDELILNPPDGNLILDG